MENTKICSTHSDFKAGNMYRFEGMEIGKFVLYQGIYDERHGLVDPDYFFALVQSGDGFVLDKLPINMRWIDLGNFDENMLNFKKKRV